MAHKRTTIKEVAEKAGVSVATISLIMRDMGTFPEATRERIKEVAAEMGYRPNRRAASFRTGKSKSIGFVIPYRENEGWVTQWSPMIGKTLLDVSLVAGNRGYAIVMIPPNSPELLESFGLDALILNDSYLDDPDINLAYTLGIMIGTYDRPGDLRITAHLDTGYQSMTAAALDAFAERGAQKPGLFTEPEGMSSNHHQVRSYLTWCKKHRIEPTIVRGKHNREDVEKNIRELVSEGCDAIYSFYGEGPLLLKTLTDMGKRLPDDIQLIAATAYNDQTNRELGISSTVYHPEHMVVEPVNMLIDTIEGKISPPVEYEAPWELNLYQTTK